MIHQSKNLLEVSRLRTFLHMEGVPTTKIHTAGFWYYFHTDYVPEYLEDWIECWRIIYTYPRKNQLNNLIRHCTLYRESYIGQRRIHPEQSLPSGSGTNGV